jgi:hypothetical protein
VPDFSRQSGTLVFLRRRPFAAHFLGAMVVKIRRREWGARFIHPMDPVPRTAILAPGFQETKLVRVFPAGWSSDAERFAPGSIAGPIERLRPLTSLKLPLTHAVIVFTYQAGVASMSDEDRELFWDAFGVPVFEQQLGPTNKLLASECDAHAGLHLVGDFTNLRRDRNSCVCGNPAPRLPRRPRIEELAELLA